MIVLVCGDRAWTDADLIRDELLAIKQQYPALTVIHGNAPGADTLAAWMAACLDIPVRAFPAQWQRYGRAAGPIRNRLMLDEYPTLVLAFHDDLIRSHGTKDCTTEARRRGISVRIISHSGSSGRRDHQPIWDTEGS